MISKDKLAQDVQDQTTPEAEADVSQVVALARRLNDLKTRAAEIEVEAKGLSKDIREIQLETLPAAMQRAGLVGPDGKGVCTTDFGKRVQLGTRTFADVTKPNRAKLFTWLRKHGHGDLIVAGVNHQSFGAFVREQLELGTKLPAFVKVHHETRATLVKA